MQAVLVMFRNDGERRSFSLSREMMVIGRRQDCDLMIPLGEISRKHCRIIRDGDSLRLEDLGSSNGTYVAPAAGPLPDKAIAVGPRTELSDDDRLYVGAWTRVVVRRATPDEVEAYA